MKRIPRADRIIQIRERRMGKLLARFNISTRTLEIKRRGRVHQIFLDEFLDTSQKIAYTREVPEQ